MARLTLDLMLRDVHGAAVTDPSVRVRLGPPDGVGTVTTTVALAGAPVRLDIPDGPAGPALILRATPTLYRDCAVTCTVDGAGTVRPMQPLVLPRRPPLWQPAFTPWAALGTLFTPLRRVLEGSPEMRVGQFSAPVQFAGAAFDAVEMTDESRGLAKLCLLNLYGRLREERPPGTSTPWFAGVRELLLATRERFIAEVDEAMWSTVRALAERDSGGYRAAPVTLHLENFRAIPGVTTVSAAASVKTTEKKGNLQFSVARVSRDGRRAYLLDSDIDENGGWLLHTFDLIRHAFNGGTHPVDIHECLCASFDNPELGYTLVPMPLVPLPRMLVRAAAPRSGVPAPRRSPPAAEGRRGRGAAKKR